MQATSASLLVVDDDELNCEMIARVLRRKGHEVSTATRGDVALQLIRHRPFDLVLLDVMMPGMNGMEVLRQVRQAHAPIDLPIIMATARDESSDIVKALDLGANDYVTKPLDLDVVMARVNTHLILKRATQQIRELERSLAERNEELERSNERLAKNNQRMSRDLQAAARIQKTFLPHDGPELPGVSLAWAYRPCDELGGDGLNIFPLDPAHVGMYVLDVSGHGVASALLSVTISRVLSPPTEASSILGRKHSPSGNVQLQSPASVANQLNRLFPFDPSTGQFTTLLYAILHAETHLFRYVSAGQPGPLLLSPDGESRILDSIGYPIGLAEEPYEERTVQLSVGDRLILYSDGVPEALSPSGEQFGSERLLQSVLNHRSTSLNQMVSSLLADVQRWRGLEENAQDDLSILTIEVQPTHASVAYEPSTGSTPSGSST